MDIRKMGLVLALPLVVGLACQTSGRSSDRTADAQEPSDKSVAQAGSSGDTGEPASAEDATAEGSASGQASVDPYSTGSTDSSASGSTAGATGSTDTTGSGSASASTTGDTGGSMGSTGSMGDTSTSGSMHGSSGMGMGAGSDMDMKGHASDQTVSGTVKKVSTKSIDIEASGGEKTTLYIVPETLVTVDGQDAKPAQLQEGQEVRASFNSVEGKETAVRIQAGMTAGGMGSGSMDTTSPGSTGTSMDPATGTGTSTDTGSTTGSTDGAMSPGGGTGDTK